LGIKTKEETKNEKVSLDEGIEESSEESVVILDNQIAVQNFVHVPIKERDHSK